jgi:hypothetical protein
MPEGGSALKAISFSALVILVLVAIAALTEKERKTGETAGFPPNGYVGFPGMPTPHEFQESQVPQLPYPGRERPNLGGGGRLSSKVERPWGLAKKFAGQPSQAALLCRLATVAR